MINWNRTLTGNKQLAIFVVMSLLSFLQPVLAQQRELKNERLTLQWTKTREGYRLSDIKVSDHGTFISLDHPSGQYNILYSAEKPDSIADMTYGDSHPGGFSLKKYTYLERQWENNLKPVNMNTAGEVFRFLPDHVQQENGKLVFSHNGKDWQVQSTWKLDDQYRNDILVEIRLTARLAGYYSIATPTLATVDNNQLEWAMIPGYFQSNTIQPDLVLSYAYGQGIPDKPVVFRERTATTLSPLITSKGVTIAVIPAPGTGRDPWEKDHITQKEWKLGLSVMNREGRYTPVAYHPVLGQTGSYMQEGEVRTFSFRYSVQPAGWYTVYRHAVYDVYRFADFLQLKQTKKSLSARILDMLHYVNADSTSLWQTAFYKGLQIGAQSYLGGVVGSSKDAIKNSDYGAMWMLATVTADSFLYRQRLPAALNFKLVQQQAEPGFFQGAAVGQYYLQKQQRFTEEWGNYVEPIGLTYYTMLDIGNILLFGPGNSKLKERLQLGAEKLLQWQHADGHWEVAYDHTTTKPLFTDIRDLRPTFYGLLVAYRILKEEKYLQAARKGADWLIKEGVNSGCFLGVCGDARFVADFATGQTVQALLDLYELCGDEKYKTAAIHTARIYTASIYTHPIPSHTVKTVKGRLREDWEISQAGLSFEHGGSLGSANNQGPIQLASHAGMFVRLFGLTRDSLFLDMARTAVWGRDAFVDTTTSVASYYWNAMNAGAGPYPHHAWWQIGLLTDYLISEITLRSDGRISFPKGFIAPKVGPHACYGFAPGNVFGTTASMHLPDSMLKAGNPQVDYMGAITAAKDKLYVMLLNDDDNPQTTTVQLDPSRIVQERKVSVKRSRLLDANGNPEGKDLPGTTWQITLPPYGLKIVEIVL